MFTETMKESINILISMRKKADVTQPYLFSRPRPHTKALKGTAAVRRYSIEAGLKNPNSVNSKTVRKQLATLAQASNLSKTS